MILKLNRVVGGGLVAYSVLYTIQVVFGVLVVLRRNATGKLSWEQTYRAMASEQEDWSAFGVTAADGLD